jgi:hypothetical protein
LLARVRDARTRPGYPPRELFIHPRSQNNLSIISALAEHTSGTIDFGQELSILRRQSDLGYLRSLPRSDLQGAT